MAKKSKQKPLRKCVSLRDDQIQGLIRVAREYHITNTSLLIRVAIDQYLERHGINNLNKGQIKWGGPRDIS